MSGIRCFPCGVKRPLKPGQIKLKRVLEHYRACASPLCKARLAKWQALVREFAKSQKQIVGLENYAHEIGTCHSKPYGHHTEPKWCGDPRCEKED